jgi:ribosomal-protein-alanine N-acetyltransferase
MDDLPVIHTARLTLFIAGPDDAARCVRFNRDNEAFLKPWEPPMTPRSFDPISVADVRARAVTDAKVGAAFSFAIAARGGGDDMPILGWCTFSNVIRGIFQACFLGYKLDERSQRQGYMTEALSASIDYLFTVQRLHRIQANYMPHNQRSAAVLRRLGFTVEGTARKYLFIGGEWRDHVLTSLINPDPR